MMIEYYLYVPVPEENIGLPDGKRVVHVLSVNGKDYTMYMQEIPLE